MVAHGGYCSAAVSSFIAPGQQAAEDDQQRRNDAGNVSVAGHCSLS
jgi:hypothetical protein